MEGEMDWCTTQTRTALATEALDSDLDKWISYVQTTQPIDEFEQWMNSNLPSSHYR